VVAACFPLQGKVLPDPLVTSNLAETEPTPPVLPQEFRLPLAYHYQVVVVVVPVADGIAQLP
jgi:hypothetical protein